MAPRAATGSAASTASLDQRGDGGAEGLALVKALC